MCGIAGFFTKELVNSDKYTTIVEQMGATIKHRGPDSCGSWVSEKEGIALAHQRLSILDLSQAGHQPMTSASGRFVISYNGECYNFKELRAELSETGVNFKSNTDTEAILEATEQWGVEKTLKRLNGMFAFALWDREKHELTIARDRIGIKPLYYGYCQKTLLFSSELKAFKAFPGFAPAVDNDALALYLQYKYIHAPYTIFKDIKKLLPGHYLKINPELPEIQLVQYWNAHEHCPPNVEPFVGSESEAISRLEQLLLQSLEYRQIADVPVGAFLSGGIDSSLVASLMQSRSSRKIRTFTIGFKEKQYDESESAAAIAKHLGTDHVTLEASANTALDLIPDMATVYDEPFADTSQLPTYLLSMLTKKHVTVCLSGDGGDELFTGYRSYFKSAPRLQKLDSTPNLFRHATSTALNLLSPNAWEAILSPIKRNVRYTQAGLKIEKYADILKMKSNLARFSAMSSQLYGYKDYLQNPSHPIYGINPQEMLAYENSPYTLMMMHDLLTYIPEDVLTKVDRASMAVALEVRVPLLDHKVVEFALRLPQTIKTANRKSKYPLRKLLEKYVPTELTERPKRGFSVPISEWLRTDLRDWAEDLLSETNFQRHDLLNSKTIRHHWKLHCDRKLDWGQNLWSILMYQSWAKTWL